MPEAQHPDDETEVLVMDPRDDRLRRALAPEDPTTDPMTDADAQDGMSRVFHDYGVQRRQQQRRVAFYFSLLVAVGLTAFFALQGGEDERSIEREPVAYAQHLYDRVFFTPSKGVRRANDLLKTDASARAEFLAALEHPSSHVRRVAVMCLATSRIEIPSDSLVPMLVDWNETLDDPLLVADAGSSSSHIAAALEKQRLRTVQNVLHAIDREVRAGRMKVPYDELLPHLSSRLEDIVRRALVILALDPRPETQTIAERIMREARRPKTRVEAAYFLDALLAADATPLLIEHLRTEKDPSVQLTLSMIVEKTPAGLAFFREQLRSGDSHISARMHWAVLLAMQGEPRFAEALVEDALTGGDETALRELVRFARASDRRELRSRILEAARGLPYGGPSHILVVVMHWDLDTGDEERMQDGLALAQTIRRLKPSAFLRGKLVRYQDKGSPAFQKELRALIAELDADIAKRKAEGGK